MYACFIVEIIGILGLLSLKEWKVIIFDMKMARMHGLVMDKCKLLINKVVYLLVFALNSVIIEKICGNLTLR